MRKGLLVLVTLALLNTLLAATAFAAPKLKHLSPGETETLEQKVPINIVFVGYDKDTINEEALRAQLPESYEPVVRFPQFYGLPGRDMGLRHIYAYNLIHAPKEFEHDFFRYLRRIGRPGDLTEYQQLYNEQATNILDVTGPVLYIDAPSVEEWLMEEGEDELDINPERSYTVYLINWHGRRDFQFHVYTKTDDKDPDTGFTFGQLDSRKLIAWGGSHGRTWFYDLSAGPEAWTGNFIVDERDLDGNGVEDYRMPPIWEYAEGGYRAPTALSSDLGLVLRYVAINLLFTASPLYDPLVTTPGRGGDKVVQIELFEDDPAEKGEPFIDKERIIEDLEEFQPYYDWRAKLDVNDPVDPEVARALRIFTGLILEDDCWTAFGDPFAELFCFFDANRGNYFPSVRPKDYQIPVVAFNTDNVTANNALPLGFADDNWTDGTQSFVFAFDTPADRAAGYGFTVTIVHEVGHHIGASHPHDGYDSEHALDYGPEDEFFFVWSGDESATVMSYIDTNFAFGTFDRDNMYRWETAGYLNAANELAGAILAAPNAERAEKWLRRADSYAGRAKSAFKRWDYERAVKYAYQAYLAASEAARYSGVTTAPVLANAELTTVQGTRTPETVPWYVLEQQGRRLGGE